MAEGDGPTQQNASVRSNPADVVGTDNVASVLADGPSVKISAACVGTDGSYCRCPERIAFSHDEITDGMLEKTFC